MSKNIFKKVLDNKITRRSFIKWSSAIGATASLAGLVVNESANLAAASTSASVTADSSLGGQVVDYIPSNCLVCHSWCRIAVGIDANKVVRKIEGVGGQPKPATTSHTGYAADGTALNNQHDDTYVRYCQAQAGQLPYSTHNRGRICAKGNDGMEHLYDPDRVKYPLVRVGKRNSGKWRKVSWGELYHGDKTVNSASTQDILIDNGSGKYIHWQGIARIMRDLGDSSANAPGSRIGSGYDYTDGSGNYYSDIPTMAGTGSTAPDRRHRLLVYIGRNEGGDIWGRFCGAYGTNMRIEHTNLCEESRHTANEWYTKDKFPISNLYTHNSGKVITDTRIAVNNNKWTLSDKDNCDCFLSWGGNHVESTIPHTSISQRVADVRRRGGLIVGIDVRQSNTLAYADQQFYVKPGTDGALAAGILYEIMAGYSGGVAALKARVDSRPNTGANYVGVFAADEGSTIPVGKSIETYLFNSAAFATAYGISGTLSDGRSATTPQAFDAAYASTICGVSAVDIQYLAWLISGGFGAGNSIPPGGTASINPPRNPLVDGYRGPAKHSNGAYNYGLLRALQFIACGFDDGTADANNASLTESIKRAGGFNRPGGLIYDSYKPGTVTTGPGKGPAPGGAANNVDPGWPQQQQAPYPALDKPQKIDNWDYHGNGGSKWRCGAHNIFSNTLVGVRASLGLDPYVEGRSLTTINSNPFGKDYLGNTNPAGFTYDNTFAVEAILLHKVNAVYDLPNPAIEHELLTKTGSNGYLLKHLWACDLNMGDSTRYADAILPDSSYLERYDYDSRENVGHLGHMSLRQPAIQDANGKNLTLYGSKAIRNILYGLARAIEADTVDANGDSTAIGNSGAGYSPWNGSLFNSFNWVTSGAGAGDSDWSDRDYMKIIFDAAPGMPYAGYPDGFTYFRTNGTWEGTLDHTPNFWKDDYHKVDSTAFTGGMGKIEFYHARLDAVTDPTAGEVGKHADGTFYGTPIYDAIRKLGSASGTGAYNLTTYRLNVHTNARTASCPRLEEIIGSNWAVMAPGSVDIHGTPIQNGDKVKVTSTHDDGINSDATVSRSIVLEAKVTPKISSGVVAVSHSQGHDLSSFGGDGMGGKGYEVVKSTGTIHNRDDQGMYTAPEYGGVDTYRLATAPSAPSTKYNANYGNGLTEPTVSGLNHGAHPQWAINRGGEDPVGTSVAWFDTMVTVEII